MVYSEVVHVVGTHSVTQTLLFFYSSLVTYGMGVVLFRDVFAGIGTEVIEQVEFGAFQKLGERQLRRRVSFN